jgi:hypothetical protein
MAQSRMRGNCEGCGKPAELVFADGYRVCAECFKVGHEEEENNDND